MGGLYSRALVIYRGDSNLHPDSEDDDGSSIDEIPISERDTVLEEIDRVIETNRVRIGADELKLVARSSGRLLPLAANLIIALIAAALLLVFSGRLNRQERLLQSSQGGSRQRKAWWFRLSGRNRRIN